MAIRGSLLASGWPEAYSPLVAAGLTLFFKWLIWQINNRYLIKFVIARQRS